MSRSKTILKVVIIAALATPIAVAVGQAGAAPQPPAAATSQGTPPARPPTIRPGDLERMQGWARLPDIVGKGPYPADYAMAPGGRDMVVYHPKDLAAATRSHKLGVYVWGNGGCSFDGATARFHLTEIASHGYVAVAPGRIQSGPKAPPTLSGAAAGGRPAAGGPRSTPEAMTAALNWILAENDRVGGPLYQKLDISRVAIGGNSCGGLLAIKTALDPRAKVVVVQNSGVFPDSSAGAMTMATKADLAKLHTPILYVTGGPEDVAQPNALDDFQRVTHVPIFIADRKGAGHVGVFLEPYGEGTKVELDWLAWQFDRDRVAAQTFVGAACKLCGDANWTVHRKGIS